MKLPEHAKRVFEGKIFHVYQWEQEMFDGTVSIFEGLKGPNAAEIIVINEDGTFCLTHEEQPGRKPFYSLVAGRIEDGENELDGAKRELLEETGLASNEWELLKIYHPSSKIERNYYLYIAKNCKKVANQDLDSGEKIEIMNLSFDEFVDTVANPKFRNQEVKLDILEAYYRGGKEEIKKLLKI